MLQEQILDNIFPLSIVKAPFNLIFLILIYFIWGLAIYIIYPISEYFLLAGSITAIGLSIWTYGIIKYANKLRNTPIEEINVVNKKILVDFMDQMFNNYSLFYGVVFSVFAYTFLTTPSLIKNDPFLFNLLRGFPFILEFTERTTLIQTLLSNLGLVYLPLPISIYIFLITFDISYRMGLSFHFVIIQIKRNIKLRNYLKNQKLKEKISPGDIKSLITADKYHIIALSGGFFLLPFIFIDKFTLIVFVVIISLAFIMCLVNLAMLDLLYVQAIPARIHQILSSGKKGYMATITKNKRPHITPVIYVHDGRHLFVSTSLKSVKIKNLKLINRVAFYIETKGDQPENVLIQGKTRIYGHNKTYSLLYITFFGFKMFLIKRLFMKRFPDYINFYSNNLRSIPVQWRTNPIISRTLIEIIPFRFTYSKGSTFLRMEV